MKKIRGKTVSAVIGALAASRIAISVSKKLLDETIRKLAYNSPSTGLPNRNYVMEELPLNFQKLSEEGTQGALICLNVDNFKMINETLGHHAGDEFIKKVSQILKEHIKDEQLLCHLGGDEFLFFIPKIETSAQVEQFADKILELFRQPIVVNGYEILYITASMGISIYPSNGTDLETLFRNADTALNMAKNSGRDKYEIFNNEMIKRISEKSQLENSLRQAIANNEFVVYYQPKVDAKTGKVVSMEALVRWDSPMYGLVQPAKFIPLAEETGLIKYIGEFVLREACRQSKIWHDKGYDFLKVAVNLSAKQLQQENLLTVITEILNETALEAKWLELEITESLLMNNFEVNINVLKKLKDIGISLYLDDFGTGYSSLNYLRQLPINSIKIDKSFIDGLTIDSKDSFIASSLINLAHGIELTVVAEGVEQLAQLDLLRNYGCDEIQGYYFSKPLNVKDFERFLEENNLN